METLTWMWTRYRPEEGWLSLALVTAAVGCMAGTVLAAAPVPEDQVVIPAAFLGLFLATLLAQRRVPASFAWLLLAAYGLLIPTLILARLWPPGSLLVRDWSSLRQYWLQNGALFLQRFESWFGSVLGSGRSEETVGLAFLMGIGAWFLAAFLGWSTFRSRTPTVALALMAIVVGAFAYFGETPLEWAAAFVAIAGVTIAVVYYADLEQRWQAHGVGYSPEIRPELLLYVGSMGLGLLAMGLFVPRINPRAIAESFLGESLVEEAEDALAHAFGATGTDGIAPGQVGGVGVFPRAYLLGNAPELAETVVMTAAVSTLEASGELDTATGRHWRGLSYEIYTGRGWALSPEEILELDAGMEVPLPPAAATVRLGQTVSWQLDERPTRYTLGLPQQFDQDVITYWRGSEDLVRVVSLDDPIYYAETRLSVATPEQLGAVSVQDVPEDLYARYSALPDSVPQRVHELAEDVAGGLETPYQQARALEAFLRQYPYSLEVPPPSADADPVDFFLFELQRGYCDYYASAMVVMARSLGLPARLATGFLAQPPDDNGLQVIRQINAHSWAELYFPEYGWIEFEPTRPFVSRFATEQDPATAAEATPFDLPEAVPLPEPGPESEQQPSFPWWQVVPVVAAVLALVSLWLRLRPFPRKKTDTSVLAYYAKLQRRGEQLGHPAHAGQTVYEFVEKLLHHLDCYPAGSRRERLARQIREPVARLAALFVERQYGGPRSGTEAAARQAWQQIRRPLWWLALMHRFQDPPREKDA